MRIVGAITLGLVATMVGLSAAFWIGVSGLIYDGGFARAHYWERDESEIGVAFGVIALVFWLALLGGVAAVLGGGSSSSRSNRVTLGVTIALSVVSVVGGCVMVLFDPLPANEYPLPPWNRA